MTAPRIATGTLLRRAADRFVTRTGWAETRHSFSFGRHYDPDNVGFGSLLAINDDLVLAGAGYDPHPHSDTEILTWVLRGSLVHEDSAGNRELVAPGLVQRLSAGSGIVHAERNDAYRTDPDRPAEPVRLIQMWLRPDAPGSAPSYQLQSMDLGDLSHGWVPIAAGGDRVGVVGIGTAAATLWGTRLGPGHRRMLTGERLQLLMVTGGSVEVESVGLLRAGDELRLTGGEQLRLTGATASDVLVWGMA